MKTIIKSVGDKPVEDWCPICDYKLSDCQCRYGGSCHPNRSKRRRVVLDHLYLFNDAQIAHIAAVQKDLGTSYGDEDRAKIYEEIRKEYGNG